MTIGPKPVAELRDWVECVVDGYTAFQGRVYNDITHRYQDGHFVTIPAHDIHRNPDGILITTHNNIYVLWNKFKRKPRGDLFNED